MAVNVLFTSAGRRVELLQAFREAFQQLGIDGRIITADIDPLAPSLQLADRSYIVPRLDSPDYISKLIKICQHEHIGLVFPLIDHDIPVLARCKQDIEATGARLAVVPPEAAEITYDKWLTSQFFEGLGLRVPCSWLPSQLVPEELDYPVFIKPRGGSASEHAFPVSNAHELTFFMEYVPNPIIQEFLPGPEITCDVICGLDKVVWAVVCRQRIEVRRGEVAKGITVSDPVIVEACLKVAEALPAIGPITVQCILKEGAPHFTEINPRIGGGSPLAIAAGADFPRWYIAWASGLDVEVPPLGSYETGLYLTRYDQSFFLTEQDF
jgi:carbamoyl-phosphate synthase large subunit